MADGTEVGGVCEGVAAGGLGWGESRLPTERAVEDRTRWTSANGDTGSWGLGSQEYRVIASGACVCALGGVVDEAHGQSDERTMPTRERQPTPVSQPSSSTPSSGQLPSSDLHIRFPVQDR